MRYGALLAAAILPLMAGCDGARTTTKEDIPVTRNSIDSSVTHTNRLISVHAGRPVLMHNGEPVPEAIYCDYILSNNWEERVAEFAANGVRVFLLNVKGEELEYFWGLDGRKPPAEVAGWTMERQVAAFLKHQPDALFFVRTGATVPGAWAAAHPDDMQTDEDGHRHADATLASPRYLEDVHRTFTNLVAYCEGRPWGDRIVGYLEASYGEGVMPLNIAGKMFDCSPANETAFREWLRARYATDDALRQAWGRPDITLASARVPRDRDWLERKRSAHPTIGGSPAVGRHLVSNSGQRPTGLFHWIEADQARAEHDYCRFMRDSFLHKYLSIARRIKAGARALGRERAVGFDVTKEPLLGWQIQSSFDGVGDGQTFPNILQLSGSYDVGAFLDDPAIDLIFTPADYHARTIGFAYEAEGLSDSLVYRGKPMLIENDARSWVGQGREDQGAFRTPQEAGAGLLRNAGLTLSRGLQSYWCNVGSSYFHDPELQKIVGRLVPMLDKNLTSPHRETRDAIAFVIDDESLMTEDFTSGYQTLSVIWQRVLGLAHCGVPYRLLLLSDLKLADLPDYKVWFFPNLFIIDDARLALLRSKVLRNGNVAIFGPSTGISDGTHLGASGATRVLNVPMELIARTTVRHAIVQDFGHPITRELSASLTYGDSLPYGPTLVPKDRAVEKAGGTPLGHATLCWYIHRTGLFLKEEGLGPAGNGKPGPRGEGDYGVVWSCAMPLPADLLRAVCRYAGCHIWCEEDDVVYASDSVVCLHSVKAGPRTIRLPRPFTVTDAVTGEKLGKSLSKIDVNVNPPQTFIFRLE